jgi:hypothetical protein
LHGCWVTEVDVYNTKAIVMSNIQFSVLYIGHPVAITVLEHNLYLVQVTYKPLHISLQKDEEGREHWIDLETQQESYLSGAIGKLIEAHSNIAEAV